MGNASKIDYLKWFVSGNSKQDDTFHCQRQYFCCRHYMKTIKDAHLEYTNNHGN
jgi:hypothetical protein